MMKTKKAGKPKNTDDIKVKVEWGEQSANEFYSDTSRLGRQGDNWRCAWNFLKAGVPIMRMSWMGYWMLENNKLVMHCKDGSLVTLDKCDEVFTLDNIASDDWIPVTQRMKKNLDAVHAAKILAYHD